MRVLVPTMLRSYTLGAAEVEAGGADLAALLADLDRRYPGLRFRVVDEQGRIRTHVRIFVDAEAAPSLDLPLASASVVQIVGALSGG
jgi:molybdopterin converting factor small subunit